MDENRYSCSAPFDSIREYIEALEERGLLMRFEKLDQDAYEMTALMYRFIDHYGWNEAPVILAEQLKINGKWVKVWDNTLDRSKYGWQAIKDTWKP